MIENTRERTLLEKWCLPEDARCLRYNIDGEMIEIQFFLNNQLVVFETDFPGWGAIEHTLKQREIDKESQYV